MGPESPPRFASQPLAVGPTLRTLADTGDLDRLAEALRLNRPGPDEIGRLLRHAHGRVVQVVLTWLATEVPRTADPEVLEAWAALLPTDARGLPAEVHPLLAQVVVELAPWGAPLPDWAGWGLPPALAVPWLTASLLVAPAATVAAVGASEALLHALEPVRGSRCLAPPQLVDALLALADPRVLPAALRVLHEAARAGALAPAELGPRLQALVERGLTEALSALNEPWAQALPLPRSAVLAALADPATAAPALAVLVARGEAALLEAVARQTLPGPWTAALAALGAFAASTAVLLDLAEADPLAAGPALRQALATAHRRGCFVQAAEVPRLLALYLVHRGWPPAELAQVCHTVRDALVETVGRVEATDPAWPQLLPVLAASEATGAPAAVRTLLQRRPPAATERAALETVTALADGEAEALALDLLPRHPAEALATLRVIGGVATVRSLRHFLGIEPAGEVAPWLLAHLEAGVNLLWQLCPPRSAGRTELLARLNPAEVPRLVSADVAEERSGAARRMALNSTLYLGPDQALIRLAALGEEGTWDTLYGLLRQTVVGLYDGTVAGDAPLGTEHTRGRPHLPTAVVEALMAHGQLLARRGRIRPACLARPGDPGKAFVAEIILDLALWGGLEAPMQACLLAALEPLRVPGLVARIHPLLRHRDPEVRAAAVRILVTYEAGDTPQTERAEARALGFSLSRLLREDDPVTLRPALEAVARFGLRGATAAVAACLDHPNMNIKKTAAEALALLEPTSVVDALVGWLGRHDNPGFRTQLNRAYDAARVGAAPLVTALGEATEPRTQGLLLEALEGRLTALHLRRLLMAGHPAAELIVQAVAGGRLRLQDGDAGVLRVELRRYRLPAADRLPAPPVGPPAAIEALERRGVSLATARAALADPAAYAMVSAFVRRQPRPWLSLLPELEPAERALLAPLLGQVDNLDAARAALEPLLALLAQTAADPEATDALLTLLGAVGAHRPGAVAGRIIDAVRLLPATAAGEGHRRWLTLGRLGAIPGRADLVACLADCAQTADPVGRTQALLCQAFQVAAPASRLSPSLLAAVQAPSGEALAEMATRPARDPGARISSLIAVWHHARPIHQAALLDIAEALQPLGLSRWIKGLATPAPRPKAQLEGVERLAALRTALASPDPAVHRPAAIALLDWPDVPEEHAAVLTAWLEDRVPVPVDRQWRLADLLVARPELLTPSQPAAAARGLELASWLALPRMRLLVDRLWALWEAGIPGAQQSLRRLGASFLLPRVAASVAEGHLTAATLLTHGALPRGPLLDRVVAALQAGGQSALADDLVHRARPGPLGTPDPPETPAPVPGPGPDREAIVAAARGSDGAAARAALDQLARLADPELEALLLELVHHRDPARRILALRWLKRVADREVYLDATLHFLEDPRPDVQRSVIRTLAHARAPAGVRPIAALLMHRQRIVRDAAAEAMEMYGEQALPVLKQLLRRARPDQRHVFESLVARIEGAGPPSLPPRGL